MKHFKQPTLIFAAILCALLLGACASQQGPKTVTLTQTLGSSADIVTLHPGDTLRVVLLGNPPSGGFAWQNAGLMDTVLEQQGGAVYVPSDKQGEPGKVVMTFVAKHAGAQMLNLVYRRPNDNTMTPTTATYGVSVVVQ